MQTVRCEYCGAVLSSSIELATGLCVEHQKLLGRDNSIVGMCWNCNSVTLIQERPRHLREAFTEKYIFSKKCSKCGGTKKDNEDWITFNKFNPDKKFIEDYITQKPQPRKVGQDNVKIIYDL